jgi:hypothetical protein
MKETADLLLLGSLKVLLWIDFELCKITFSGKTSEKNKLKSTRYKT